MLPDEILEIELTLLLIKYGEKKMVKSLSKIIHIDIKDLQIKLKSIIQIEKKKPIEKSKQLSQMIEEIIKQHHQKANLLKILFARYESRSFLPELRDIKRLLNRHSIESDQIKSRKSAAAKVFKLLASLEEKELEELTEQHDRANFSSLGIISDEILGRKD